MRETTPAKLSCAKEPSAPYAPRRPPCYDSEGQSEDILWNAFVKYDFVIDVANFIFDRCDSCRERTNELKEQLETDSRPCLVVKSKTWTHTSKGKMYEFINSLLEKVASVGVIVIQAPFWDGSIKLHQWSKSSNAYEISGLFNPISTQPIPVLESQISVGNSSVIYVKADLSEQLKELPRYDSLINFVNRTQVTIEGQVYEKWTPKLQRGRIVEVEVLHDLKGIDDYLMYNFKVDFNLSGEVVSNDRDILYQHPVIKSILKKLRDVSGIDEWTFTTERRQRAVLQEPHLIVKENLEDAHDGVRDRLDRMFIG